jgi:hypothetical protein
MGEQQILSAVHQDSICLKFLWIEVLVKSVSHVPYHLLCCLYVAAKKIDDYTDSNEQDGGLHVL